ncbi:hypothetical protein P692DRAFT_201335952 [Suillus brevipes Sb2]|nr:hypothetical protein P692DRAFT_201335952 [Suillus brevipes Sb2]
MLVQARKCRWHLKLHSDGSARHVLVFSAYPIIAILATPSGRQMSCARGNHDVTMRWVAELFIRLSERSYGPRRCDFEISDGTVPVVMVGSSHFHDWRFAAFSQLRVCARPVTEFLFPRAVSSSQTLVTYIRQKAQAQYKSGMVRYALCLTSISGRRCY